MIDKIRISLWEIFTVFLSGFLAAAIGLGLLIYLGYFSIVEVKEFVFGMPTTLTVFVFPLLFTLIGMLLEPFSNYSDRMLMRRVFGFDLRFGNTLASHDKVVVDFIKSNCLGELNGKIDNPFFLCKEYVETKQLSTTFMTFLSRYGFYRNASFLTLICSGLSFYLVSEWPEKLGISALWLFFSAVFFRRAHEFYSYQAPSIYHAFLIDKLAWSTNNSNHTSAAGETNE